MYRFKSIKYTATTGLITGLLFVIGYCSSLFFNWLIIGFLGGSTALQLFDAVFIPFCAIFKGPMMLFAGSIAGALFDLVSGYFILIPITILIRILMFIVIKLLINNKWWSAFYSFLFAVLILMIGYPLYFLIIYDDKAKVINEIFGDIIQGVFAYLVALPIYYTLYSIQIKNSYHFWDDRKFDYLKPEKKKIITDKISN